MLEVRQKALESVELGQPAAVEIIVANVSRTPACGVTVTDVLPEGYDLLDAAPPADRSRDKPFWLVNCIKPGEQQAFRIRLGAKPGIAPGELRNSVVVAFPATFCATCSVPVKRPALKVVFAGAETCGLEAPITLTITAINSGSASAHGAVVRMLLPEGLFHPSGRDIEKKIGDLEPGQSRTLAVQVKPTKFGDMPVKTILSASGMEPIEQDASLRVEDPWFRATAQGPTAAGLDWPCTYDFTVVNDAVEDVAGATLTAELPKGAAFVRASDGGVYDPQAHRVVWSLPTLGPAAAATVALSLRRQGRGDAAGAHHRGRRRSPGPAGRLDHQGRQRRRSGAAATSAGPRALGAAGRPAFFGGRRQLAIKAPVLSPAFQESTYGDS